MSLTDVSLSRPSGSSWPKPPKGLIWVAGTALYVALAIYVSPWIAVYADQECRLGGITGVFHDGKREILRGETLWFVRCKHFQAGRSPLFLEPAKPAGFLTPAEMRQRFTIAPDNL